MTRKYLVALLCGLSLVALPSVAQPLAAQDPVKPAPTAATEPVRKWEVYLLPHSHVDIGYTDIQPAVERVHWRHLDQALELCRQTADYPPGARFKWNPEVVWAVDSYLRQATPGKQQQLVDAIRAGQVELHALYANELTGLCRPEELLRLMQCGLALGRRCGVAVEAAMITDTPGCPWGMVPAMAQAGVKYCALGMNFGHRIGRALIAWEDKPFYWLAPDGKQKVLCWTPFGEAIPSQRLSTGELAFLAKDVPPLAGKRYAIASGNSSTHGEAQAAATAVSSSTVSVRVDPASGAIVSVRSAAVNAELCDMKSGVGLNRYDYVLGARKGGPAGRIRVIDGLERVDIINVLDKIAVRQKESVHLGFAFNVPNGEMRIDVPWAVVRPEIGQVPGACKDWFPVGRWVDVTLHWGPSAPKAVWISNLAEEQVQVVTGPVKVPAFGIVTLRAEWP